MGCTPPRALLGWGKARVLGSRAGQRSRAARHGNLEHCLKQKPAYRTPRAPRSRSQRQTLMYRCPISAFNWCPLGQATRELRRRELSRQALSTRSQGNRQIIRPGGTKSCIPLPPNRSREKTKQTRGQLLVNRPVPTDIPVPG